MNDLRFAFRQLLKNPGFTAVAVLTLALGIGATTAIFNVVINVLFDPLPAGASGAFCLKIENPSLFRTPGVSSGVWHELVERGDVFEALATYQSVDLEVDSGEFIQRFHGALVTPNFFDLIGMAPALGRPFRGEEARKGNGDVIIISHGFWKEHLAQEAEILGKPVRLGQRSYTIVGVMPAEFRFPDARIQMWLPFEGPERLAASETGQVIWDPSMEGISGNWPILFRPQQGITDTQAQAMFDSIAHQRVQARPQLNEGWTVQVVPLKNLFADEKLQDTLYTLLGAIAFLLLIVCANIANLLLTRTEKRRRELAIREALGASRVQLFRQFFCENLLLAWMGGIGALIVSFWTMDLLTTLIPPHMPRLKEFGITPSVLGTTLAVSLIIGIGLGWVAALRSVTFRVNEALKAGELRSSADSRRSFSRASLVVSEIALALALLTGAGLMGRSVWTLLNVDPGFATENLVQVKLDLPQRLRDHEAAPQRLLLFRQIHERFQALPGVASVATYLPGGDSEFLPEGRDKALVIEQHGCSIEDHDYFDTIGAPLLAGRKFVRSDAAGGIGLVGGKIIVNETLARICWPGESAIGKRVELSLYKFSVSLPEGVSLPLGTSFSMRGPSYEVIGVVGDTREQGFNQEPKPRFYQPLESSRSSTPYVLVKTRTTPQLLIRPLRNTLTQIETRMGMPEISIMEDVLYDSTAPQRAYMRYLLAFAAIGLTLASIGIYGVLSHSVTQRTREIGVRLAVGAQRGDILRLIMRQGTKMICAGIIIGLILAVLLTRLMQGLLFGVNTTDPIAFAAVLAVLSAVAFVSCYLPARRAMKINPMDALRTE